MIRGSEEGEGRGIATVVKKKKKKHVKFTKNVKKQQNCRYGQPERDCC